ncbi:hypothetical protein NLM24_31575 [Nocardia zapadnayensis]|uniref:hypothetical protein n=1 Tax=Nocardia TaxID=1817 RepID=UPI002245003F|nr:hypothetical protein [Nocardia zapadnayensis]MCX0275149.1 hypothetical protein [Nocardia zapadnayensis]
MRDAGGHRVSEPGWVDSGEMRYISAVKLNIVADELAQMVLESKITRARWGGCRDGEKPNKISAETYVPSAEHGMKRSKNLVVVVHACRTEIR